MSKPLPTIEEVKANTAFKTDKRAEAVLETLKWLEAGAPHKFDGLPGKFEFNMDLYIDHEDSRPAKRPDPDCGTACCIAGAIRMYERDGKTYKGGNPNTDIPDHFPVNTVTELHDLFYASNTPSTFRLSDITPRGAAKTLRRYIKKGVVKWKVKEQ